VIASSLLMLSKSYHRATDMNSVANFGTTMILCWLALDLPVVFTIVFMHYKTFTSDERFIDSGQLSSLELKER
jgi:hypothetical protein